MEKVTTNIRAGIITASDRCFKGQREDQSGLLLKALVESLGGEVIAYRVLPDDRETLARILSHLADGFRCDLILTTGGTGLGPRDVTPEATKEIIEKEILGISEAIRSKGLAQTPHAMLSRGIAGIRKKTLVVNLPGNPQAVQEAFEILRPILPHAIELIRGKVKDCREALFSSSPSPSSLL